MGKNPSHCIEALQCINECVYTITDTLSPKFCFQRGSGASFHLLLEVSCRIVVYFKRIAFVCYLYDLSLTSSDMFYPQVKSQLSAYLTYQVRLLCGFNIQLVIYIF